MCASGILVTTAAAVAATLTVGCARMRRDAADSTERVVWSFERGWLSAAGVCRPGMGPALNLQIADMGAVLPREGVAPDEVRSAADGTHEVCYRRPAGTLTDVYRPFPDLGPDAWQRSIHYTNTSATRQDLGGLELYLSPIAVPAGVAWRPWTFRMQEVGSGRMLCTAYWTHVEHATLSTVAEVVQAHVAVGWRLEPGQSAELGHQGIWLGQAGAAECREEARRWYVAHGFREPVRYPSWLRETILYEVSAAGHIDSRFSDVGGFAALAHQVPYLADLGVSAVWLNAVQQHKTPPDALRGGWNHYDPHDFLSVDPILGGKEGLRALLSTFRDHGIYVLSEIVPHGGHSVQADGLRQWWTRERDGTLRRNWGGAGMDDAAPEWQAVLRDSMAMLGSLGEVDGARIDVAEGQGPNWDSPRTPRASFSGLGASVEMLEAVRDGLRAGGCQRPVLIPEAGDYPVFFAIPDAAVLGYGWGLTNLLAQTPDRLLADSTELNRLLYADFEENAGALPPGALVLRTLNNHDTVCDKGRVQQRFGAGLHRALYGVCLSVPGVPMLYQEEEIGAYVALRRLNWARRALPWLTDSEAVFLPPGFCDERVFTVWRCAGEGQVLCLVNLSGQPVVARAALPDRRAQRAGLRLTDAVSGVAVETGPDGLFAWALEPYATAFLRVGRGPGRARLPVERFSGETAAPAPAPTPSPECALTAADGGFVAHQGGVSLAVRFGAATTAWQQRVLDGERSEWTSELGVVTLTRREASVDLRCELRSSAAAAPAVTVGVTGADRWGVSGRTALLEDRFVRRHFPFPASSSYQWDRTQGWGQAPWGGLYDGVAPSGRLWQSLLEPLHPDHPALGFCDLAGVGFVLTQVQTDAMNVVLTDCTDEGTVPPLRLETRFLAVDSDLHPEVQRFGQRPVWTGQGLPALPARPLVVSFTLTPVRTGLAQALAAARLPRPISATTETREGERFAEMGGRVFLISPGQISWSDLPAADSICQLELELRLSERSAVDTDLADAYRVSVDGVVQPLTWGRKGVWSTGNAYFALARTPPIDLRGRRHTLTVETLRPWCALRPRFALVADPAVAAPQ